MCSLHHVDFRGIIGEHELEHVKALGHWVDLMIADPRYIIRWGQDDKNWAHGRFASVDMKVMKLLCRKVFQKVLVVT